MSALDLFNATPAQVLELMDTTDDDTASRMLLDLYWALDTEDDVEVFKAVSSLSDYVVYGPGGLKL